MNSACKLPNLHHIFCVTSCSDYRVIGIAFPTEMQIAEKIMIGFNFPRGRILILPLRQWHDASVSYLHFWRFPNLAGPASSEEEKQNYQVIFIHRLFILREVEKDSCFFICELSVGCRTDGILRTSSRASLLVLEVSFTINDSPCFETFHHIIGINYSRPFGSKERLG